MAAQPIDGDRGLPGTRVGISCDFVLLLGNAHEIPLSPGDDKRLPQR